MQSYDEVINYLYDHLPYYQRSGQAAYKSGLENTLALDAMFNHPHQTFKSVHVAGTNGKGSVSHMLASILFESGYNTGLYTSPHLKDFRERIRINGAMIDEKFVVNFVAEFLKRNSDLHLEPSFFELTVMMAFDYFSQRKVDVAIIEVGLGGRLDSTNIINPDLSIITNISLDHTIFLGDTLGKIALEKAGIIKSNRPIVIGESHPQTTLIFQGVAREHNAPVTFADQFYNPGAGLVSLDGCQIFTVRKSGVVVYPNLKVGLLGSYQSKNLTTLLTAIEKLREQGYQIPESAVRKGLENICQNTGLMGRWQIIGSNPRIVCDTGHNEGGIREVVNQLNHTPHKKLHVVIGVVNDKDIAGILNLLPKDAYYYFTKAAIPRALDEKVLQKMGLLYNLTGECYPTVISALQTAKENADADDLIFIGGSTFVVAEAIP
jgi:dihydrofolate synthase / folylpolyglutamate synthase